MLKSLVSVLTIVLTFCTIHGARARLNFVQDQTTVEQDEFAHENSYYLHDEGEVDHAEQNEQYLEMRRLKRNFYGTGGAFSSSKTYDQLRKQFQSNSLGNAAASDNGGADQDQ